MHKCSTCADGLGIFALSKGTVIIKRSVSAVLELIVCAWMKGAIARICVLTAIDATSDYNICFVVPRLCKKDETEDKVEQKMFQVKWHSSLANNCIHKGTCILTHNDSLETEQESTDTSRRLQHSSWNVSVFFLFNFKRIVGLRIPWWIQIMSHLESG